MIERDENKIRQLLVEKFQMIAQIQDIQHQMALKDVELMKAGAKYSEISRGGGAACW